MKPLVKHYGNKQVSEFGPLSLKFIREKWIEAGHSLSTIRKREGQLKAAFRWAAENEMISAETANAICLVRGLKKGRSKARNPKKVKPVPDEVVERTIPFMSPIVADAVRVHRLCAMRSQDVINLRAADIDRSQMPWKYIPHTHKNANRELTREIAIGPKARAILIPYLDKQDNPEKFLFSPKESMKWYEEEKRRNRKSKVQPSQTCRKKKNPKRKPKDQYTSCSYGKAIRRACQNASTTTTITGLSENKKYEFQVRASTTTEWSESIFATTDKNAARQKLRDTFRWIDKTTNSVTLVWPYVKKATGYEIQYRQAGDKQWASVIIQAVAFAPHMLRHAAATEVRRLFGLDAAQKVLSHSNPQMAAHYAEISFETAAKAMEEIG